MSRLMKLCLWLAMIKVIGISGITFTDIELGSRFVDGRVERSWPVPVGKPCFKRHMIRSALRLSGGQDEQDMNGNVLTVSNTEDTFFLQEDESVYNNVSGLGLTFSKEPPYKVMSPAVYDGDQNQYLCCYYPALISCLPIAGCVCVP
jgi:hypothetical protein